MGTLISWKCRVDGETTDFNKALAKQVLSVVLDAVTAPGKVTMLPRPDREPPAPWPGALSQVAQTLLSKNARFAVLGQGSVRFAHHLVEEIGAQPVPLHKADYVIAGPPLDWLDVWAISAAVDRASRPGTTLMLSSVFLPVDVIDRSLDTVAKYRRVHAESEPSHVTPLYGRGMRRERGILVDDVAARLLHQLAARVAEHPTHIDVVLADEAEHIVALPYGTWWPQGRTIWAA